MYMHSIDHNAGKRWGREFTDRRDWRHYNEQLVIRGEFYLDLGFVENWGDELEAMNRNKRGGQYKFPISLMKWFMVWKQLLDYRGLKGIARKMSYLSLIPDFPVFSTIWFRIHYSTPVISLPSFKEAEVGSDGTGLKTRNAGEYRILKYGDPDARQKKHLVVVITADVRHKKLLCVDVRIEGKGYTEASIAMEHLSSISRRGIEIRKFYGDGAYDQSSVFDKLHEIGAKPVVKIRRNSTGDWYRGSKYRNRVVREYRMMGYERWARENNYGMRWPGTEGIFSAVKRKFGENTVSRSIVGLLAEGYQRFWVYDEMREYGEKHISVTMKG